MAPSKRVVPRDTPRQLGGGLSHKRFDSDSLREQRAAFDVLRKQSPVRREIEGLKVRIEGASPELARIVVALGAVAV